MKGKIKLNPAWFLVAIMAVGVVWFVMNGSSTTAAAAQNPNQPAPPADLDNQNKLNLCQGIASLTLNTAAFNPLSSATAYTANAVRIVGDSAIVAPGQTSGSVVATGTLTAGSTLSYAALAIPCNAQAYNGVVYAMSDTTNNNSAAAKYSISGTGGTLVMTTSVGDELQLTIRAYPSQLSISANATEDPTENAATAMSAGDVRTIALDVQAGNVGATSFGSLQLGVLEVIDTVDSAAFTDSGVSVVSSIPGFVEVTNAASLYPKAMSVLSGNRVYWMPAITTQQGLSQQIITIRNDGGTNAGASSDPTINFCDLQFYEKTGAGASTISIDCYDNSGTDLGQGLSVVTTDNS